MRKRRPVAGTGVEIEAKRSCSTVSTRAIAKNQAAASWRDVLPIHPAAVANLPILAEHAAAIRALGKQTIENVIEIGRHLYEAKQIIDHGGWLPWLDREFKWTDRTALNFMRVYEMAGKSETVSDLKLPIGALYLLAAPSTPEAALVEVTERAEAGEVLPTAEVKQIIEKHQGRTKRKKPTTAEARGNVADVVTEIFAEVFDTEPDTSGEGPSVREVVERCATSHLAKYPPSDKVMEHVEEVADFLVQFNSPIAKRLHKLLAEDNQDALLIALERRLGIESGAPIPNFRRYYTPTQIEAQPAELEPVKLVQEAAPPTDPHAYLDDIPNFLLRSRT